MGERRAFQLYAHITWHTWKRVGCVSAWMSEHVLAAARDAAGRCGVRVLRAAVLQDHVHLLVSFRPSTRLSDFVRLAKSGAAYRSNDVIPGCLKWARGYFVASVSKQHLPRIERYIENQFEHHPDRVPTGGMPLG